MSVVGHLQRFDEKKGALEFFVHIVHKSHQSYHPALLSNINQIV